MMGYANGNSIPTPNLDRRRKDVVFERRCHADDRWTVYIDGVFSGFVKKPHPERAQYALVIDGQEMGAWRSLGSIRKFLE